MSKLGQQLNPLESVLKSPHVTERSSALSFNEEHPVYTFVVANEANKATVRVAIEKLYSVKPVRVNIVNIPPRQVFIRGKRGQKPGFKKAMVFLKKGDKIDFV
jgi:large subunit ribosomal protein L23